MWFLQNLLFKFPVVKCITKIHPLPDGGAQYSKSQRGLQKQTNKKHQKAMPRPCLVQSNEDDVSASPTLLNPNLGARHAARFFHLLFHFVFTAARGG